MLPVTGPSNIFTYVFADALVQWPRCRPRNFYSAWLDSCPDGELGTLRHWQEDWRDTQGAPAPKKALGHEQKAFRATKLHDRNALTRPETAL